MKKIISSLMMYMIMITGISLQAKTDLSNPYTWSEGQCIMFGLLGFVVVIAGLIILAALLCKGIQILRCWFEI